MLFLVVDWFLRNELFGLKLYSLKYHIFQLNEKTYYIHVNVLSFFSVDSEDDTIIYLQEDAVWRKTKYFEDHTDIRIVGEFVSDHLYYMFLGNVSSAEEENFASMALRPRGMHAVDNSNIFYSSLN